MHLISFDASPRQVSKIRNGHAVRIKRGSGFNLVVHPDTYHLVSRAFRGNKGIQIQLSPEELDANRTLSPEQHDELGDSMDKELFTHLPMAEGGSIFKRGGSLKSIGKKINKALHSKTAKHIGRELKPLTRALKSTAKDMAKEYAHNKIAEAHMHGADKFGDNEHLSKLINKSAEIAHSKVEGGSLKSIGKKINKALHSKTAKQVGRQLKPFSRALKSTAKDLLHDQIAQAQMSGADMYGDNRHASNLMNVASNLAHQQVAGMGLGLGLYAGAHGRGMNAHEALKLANMATAQANHHLAKMHNATVHGQLSQPPIKRYWDNEMAPPSRGTGLHNHMNLIRGRGSILHDDDILPPALQSQPYGANFHMQFFLPPQYHKYNDGTDMEGRGLYI